MAKLKSVRLKQSEINLILSKLSNDVRYRALKSKLYQTSNMSGESIDDIELKRLNARQEAKNK